MKVFISYSNKDRDIARLLSSSLIENNFDVFFDDYILAGSNLYSEISKNLLKADAVIILLSKNSEDSIWIKHEMLNAYSNLEKKKSSIFITIILDDDVVVPNFIRDILYIRVINNNISVAIGQVLSALKLHEHKLIEQKEEKRKVEEKVKISLSEYITEVFQVLKMGEKRNKYFAIILYALSIFTLIISTGFLFDSDTTISTENFVLVGTFFLKKIAITTLLVALARLFFILGKSFMVESIRNSDRRHAISFGKFFLDAFGEEATRDEIINAFSAWNIDGGSSFRSQSTEEFDPKIIELLKFIKKE